MRDAFASLDGLADELAAALPGRRFVWRGQARYALRASVRLGVVEDAGAVRISGQGLQAWSENGASALASRDDLSGSALVPLARSVTRMLDAAPAPKDAREPVGLEPTHGEVWPEAADDLLNADATSAARALAARDAEWRGRHPDLRFRWNWRAELDAWRIVRDDGTDVRFAQPRVLLSVQVRADVARPAAMHESIFSLDPEFLRDERAFEPFATRLERACTYAREVPDAPTWPAGPTPLVIEYALAKGLAHEAFGHASEADGFRSSVLAEDGVFRTGERVGDERISIVDEPIARDHAWQPWSHHGLLRRPVRVVDRGRLGEALCDPWSADSAGVEPRGSARAESFRDAPLPRMTNIRLEVEDAAPLPGRFEDYDVERVSSLLADAGVFRRHDRVAWLTGYRGGQVNPTSGDFVFNCRAIRSLGKGGPRLYKPAIFSGSMFGALESIREAFGPLRLDALGYCGKWGQSVPSSGGGPWFVVLDADPRIRLGGS